MTEEEKAELSPDAMALFEVQGQTPAPNIPTLDSVSGDDEAIKKILSNFDGELVKWDGMIESITSRMRDIGKCVDVQMDLYDHRHQIVDRKHKLLRTLAKFSMKYKEQRAARLLHYTGNYDRKLTTGERDKMVDSDTAKMKYKMDLLENHVNQIDQIFKLIENVIFGLKHRLELEAYLRKM